MTTVFEQKGGIEFLDQNNDSVLLIKSSTGSGKTTSLARYYAKHANKTLISIPNRTSAINMANYLNKTDPGMFGYAIHDEHYNIDSCKVLFATTGWLVKKLLYNKGYKFDVFVLDEAHDKSIFTYMLLRIVKKRLYEDSNSSSLSPMVNSPNSTKANSLKANYPKMNSSKTNFKFIIASATISTEYYMNEFPSLKVFDLISDVTCFPFKFHNKTFTTKENMLDEIVIKTIEMEKESPDTDKIIFLDGEKNIINLSNKLTKVFKDVEICTLYGNMENEDKKSVLSISNKRKIWIATNIVQSSITLPNITHIISSGFYKQAKILSSGITELSVQYCSKYDLIQQKGRAGRETVKDKKGNIIRGYSYVMMESSKYETLEEENPRDIDLNPLFEPILEFISAKINPFEMFTDLPKYRVLQDIKILKDFKLIECENTTTNIVSLSNENDFKNDLVSDQLLSPISNMEYTSESYSESSDYFSESDSENDSDDSIGQRVYQITELGCVVVKIMSSIINAIYIYKIFTDPDFPVNARMSYCLMIAASEIPQSAFNKIYKQSNEMDIEFKLREKEIETARISMYGDDEVETVFKLYNTFTKNSKEKNNEFLKTYNLSFKYFTTLISGLNRLNRSLKKIQFKNTNLGFNESIVDYNIFKGTTNVIKKYMNVYDLYKPNMYISKSNESAILDRFKRCNRIENSIIPFGFYSVNGMNFTRHVFNVISKESSLV